MRFSRAVFAVAGVWGFLVVSPLYFLFDRIGRDYPPAITHPEFFYGFIAVTLAWQFAFLVIATDPARYRPLMLAAMVEKFGYVGTVLVLFGKGSLPPSSLTFAATDLLLGIMFVVAFFKARTVPTNAA
jgi:hypothetical protein